uniref:hypothetical protein n=1 Tax=Candidatus Electronema sp. TaxID=2698783 RepID=UPI0040561F2B
MNDIDYLPDKLDFLYSIGGLSLSVSTDSNLPDRRLFFKYQEDVEFAREEHAEHFDVAIRIGVSKCKENVDLINRLFIQERMVFYSTTNGYFQEFYQTNKLIKKIFELSVSKDFSRYSYSICADAEEEIVPCRLASSLFLLQHNFINHNGLIIHAAGGSIQGKGLVFAAPSGIGKSTLSGLLSVSSCNRFFSEDRLIIRSANDEGWRIWGTPWQGTGRIARNESVPLSALIFLSQSLETRISAMPPAVALHHLLETVSIPWYSQEWIGKGLTVCESLLRDIPAFELAFRPDQTAVQAVAELAATLG